MSMGPKNCLLSLVAVLTLAGLGPSVASQDAVRSASGADKRVPVVLELFTSEGCSSCPPADSFLASLDERQPVAGAEIIALEEHVDYWDHQGWIDPFSAAQWTQRQQTYALAFPDHGVYTPELVVDGRSGFVGSHQSDAYRAIAAAVAQPRTNISMAMKKAEKRGHQEVKVEAGRLQGAQPGDTAEVWLVIAEAGLHSAVSAGENAGRELHHAPVVRWLHKLGSAHPDAEPAFSGGADVKLEPAWKTNNLRVVALVQEKRSHRIIGSTLVRMEP